MILTKQDLVVFIAGIVLGVLAGFFSGKAIYDRPLDESVEIDTVVVYRTAGLHPGAERQCSRQVRDQMAAPNGTRHNYRRKLCA